jgi:hypothetical protein
MNRTYMTYRKVKMHTKFLSGEINTRHIVRHKRMWDDNIRIDYKGIRCEYVD